MNKDFRFDFIRTIAILFVVSIHCSTLLFKYSISDDCNAIIKMIYSLMEIKFSGVPLFVMLSGALLLGKCESPKEFLNKRINRIILPFLFWSIVVQICFYFQNDLDIASCIVDFFRKSFIGCGVHNIYWYIYLIIALYLITPPLRVFFSKAEKSDCYYLLIVLIVIKIIVLTFPDIYISKLFSSLFFEYLVYYVAGFILYKYVIHEKNFLRIAYPLLLFGIGCLCIRVFLTRGWYEYLHLARLIPSMCLFGIILKKIPSKCSIAFVDSIITKISKYSYGIYLSHFIIISILLKTTFVKSLYPIIEFPFMVSIVLVLNVILLWILNKIKIGKYIM